MKGKGKIFLILGNFGVGKTTVVNYFKHEKTNDKFVTKVKGLISLGGEAGADNLIKTGLSKRQLLLDYLTKYEKDNLIIHSNYYKSKIDILRYTKYHDLFIIYLKTGLRENMDRIAKRGKVLNYKTRRNNARALLSCMNYARFFSVPIKVIDNNREASVVGKEVWDYILGLTNG